MNNIRVLPILLLCGILWLPGCIPVAVVGVQTLSKCDFNDHLAVQCELD